MSVAKKIDIIEGELGKDAEYDLEIIDGHLTLVFSYDGPGVDGVIKVTVDVAHFLDKFKQAIPGQVDDAILELVKGALKG